MKKTLLLFLSSLFCLGMTAQGTLNSTGSLEISYNASLAPGASSNDQGWFTISLKAPAEDKFYTSYQMDIILPPGIQFNTSVDKVCDIYFEACPIYPYTQSGRGSKSWPHTLACNILADNQVRVLVQSNGNDAFKSNEGDLFDVYVKASSYVKPGDFQITIKDIKFVSPDETKYLYEDQTLTAGTVSSESTLPVKVSVANKISTAIFPFPCAIPDGLEVYSTTGIDGEYINLAKVESINAFTPYIIYSENGVDTTLDGIIDAAIYPANTFVSDGRITGVLVDTEVNAGYVLQNKGDGPKFYKIGATPFNVPAGKCYADPLGNDSQALSFMFDNEADGIQTVTTSDCRESKVVYDLQGKQVLNPESGCIYILNGKKVLKR